MEKSLKHLVIAIGGIGLCIAGQVIGDWSFVVEQSKEVITLPFVIVGAILVIIGIFCCLGAMLCETGRYDQKKI